MLSEIFRSIGVELRLNTSDIRMDLISFLMSYPFWRKSSAKALSSAGDYAGATHIYRRILVDNPGYRAAESGLAELGSAAGTP